MRWKIWLLVLVLGLLAACQAAKTLPAPTKTERPTATAAPTDTLTPTVTPTPTETVLPTLTASPQFTPTPTQSTFVREGTPIPPSEPITAENADQLVELARLGKGRIVDVQLSPDRNYLLVQTTIGVYGYLADTQEEVWRFEDPSGIAAMAVPHLERWMAVATNDGQIALLIYRRGTMFTRWYTGYEEITDLAFSYEDDLLAAVGDQGVTVWEVGETEPVYAYPEIQGELVRFTPDGEGLIVKGEKNTTIYYSLSNGERLKVAATGNSWIWEFSRDGAYMSNGESVWDGFTGEFLYDFERPDWVNEDGYVAFSYDSRYIAINSFHDEFIYILRADDGEEILSLRSPFFKLGKSQPHSGKLAAPAKRSGGYHPYYTDLVFSTDGNYLAAATSDEAVEIWNLPSGEFTQQIPSLGDQLLFRKASRLIVWGYNSLEQVDPMRGISFHLNQNFNSLRYDKFSVNDPIAERKVIFSGDGEWVIAENIIWYLPESKRIYRLGEEAVLVSDVDGDYIYTFENVTDIVRKRRVGDFAVVDEVNLIPPYVEDLGSRLSSAWIGNITISTDGRFLSGYIYEYGLATWDLESGETIDELYSNHQTYGGQYSPDTEYLYVWGYNGLIVYRLDSYRQVFELDGSYQSFYEILYFSRDGRYLLINNDGISRYRVYADHLELVMQIDQRVNDLVVSPDNSLIALNVDTQLVLVDFETGVELRQIPNLGEILDIAFSPDGRYIATSSWDGTIRIWGVPVED